MRAETGWPSRGRAFWLAASAVTALIAVCALSSLRWWERPFPGFFLWANRFVPAVGDNDWTGYQAEVPYQSRLVSVDGAPVVDADQVYQRAAEVPIGTPLRYGFRTRDGREVALAVPTMRLDAVEYLLTLGNYLAVGSVLALLGFLVLYLRPDAPAARAMFAAGLTWGLYLVTAADIFGPGWFRPLCLLLQALGPVTLVHLALTFPVERPAARHAWLLPALYGAAMAVGIADNLAFAYSYPTLLAIDRLNSVALILGGVVLLGSLVDALWRPASATARQRTKLAALGGVAAFAIPIAGFVAFYLLGISFPLNFVTFSMLLFPVAISYAIVRHDLFEVDAIIRRAVAWAILSAIIAAAYLGGIGAVDLLFTGGATRVAQLLFLLVIVAVLNPLRDRVQAGVDALFARRRYDYRATVTEVSESLARLLDRDAIVARMLDTIASTMQVDPVSVWLRDERGDYLPYAHSGAGGALPPRVPADAPLPRRLADAPSRILTDEGGDAAVFDSVAPLGAILLVPIAFERRPLGFLALGRKASGRFYSGEDRGLLQTLASQGAMALENARAYQALAQSNAELRTTQQQLIQAERLAAIGEVSAAVAHGIRNPLAGIKAAARVAALEVGGDHPVHATIDDIVGESNRLEARIKALLDFAKPFEPHPTECGVRAVIDEAVHALRAQTEANRIRVTIDADHTLTARFDRGQIAEVLLVLIANAIEVMPDGGTLAVTADADDGRLRIDVHDSGPGIAPHQMQRLFQLFATTKPTGTGLGLAVAKKIVERHGGRIAVASEPGTGSVFRIELPRG
jgi:signal transduction histidine kinase